MGRLSHAQQACVWTARASAARLTRRFGAAGWTMLACAVIAALALALAMQQKRAARALSAHPVAARTIAPPADPMAAARGRLQAFQALLLAPDALPDAVQDLLDLGEAQGLSLQRGSYHADADQEGGYLRYRIAMPARGPGASVERFLTLALEQHPALALESVQFRRAGIGERAVEAQIQWVLLARLPAAAPGAAR